MEEVKRGRGRPKGSPNKGTQLGRKTIFKSLTIAGSPAEIEEITQKAKDAGKSASRYLIDLALGKQVSECK